MQNVGFLMTRLILRINVQKQETLNYLWCLSCDRCTDLVGCVNVKAGALFSHVHRQVFPRHGSNEAVA